MTLRLLELIIGMKEGVESEGVESKIFLCSLRGSAASHQSFASEVTYLVHVDCLYLIKRMVIDFCWRFNWTVGSSINVLSDLILFQYQTAIKYTINLNY